MDEKANYQLETSVDEGIVEIVVTGEIKKDTLERLRTEVTTIIREKNAKALLWDARAAKGLKDNLTEAYFRARTVPRDVKIVPCALVDFSEDRDYQAFYETTAANVGQTMKYFTDIDAARAWLKSRLEEMRRT